MGIEGGGEKKFESHKLDISQIDIQLLLNIRMNWKSDRNLLKWRVPLEK